MSSRRRMHVPPLHVRKPYYMRLRMRSNDRQVLVRIYLKRLAHTMCMCAFTPLKQYIYIYNIFRRIVTKITCRLILYISICTQQTIKHCADTKCCQCVCLCVCVGTYSRLRIHRWCSHFVTKALNKQRGLLRPRLRFMPTTSIVWFLNANTASSSLTPSRYHRHRQHNQHHQTLPTKNHATTNPQTHNVPQH